MDRENTGGRPDKKQGSVEALRGCAHSCFVLFGGATGAGDRKESEQKENG